MLNGERVSSAEQTRQPLRSATLNALFAFFNTGTFLCNIYQNQTWDFFFFFFCEDRWTKWGGLCDLKHQTNTFLDCPQKLRIKTNYVAFFFMYLHNKHKQQGLQALIQIIIKDQLYTVHLNTSSCSSGCSGVPSSQNMNNVFIHEPGDELRLCRGECFECCYENRQKWIWDFMFMIQMIYLHVWLTV